LRVSAPSRLPWYHKLAVDQGLTWSGQDVAPHGYTIRSQYTPETDVMALVFGGYASAQRITAAAALGRAKALLNTGAGTVLECSLYNNTPGAREWGQIATQEYTKGGTTVSIGTWDDSTGGTCDYVLSLIAEEFDVVIY